MAVGTTEAGSEFARRASARTDADRVRRREALARWGEGLGESLWLIGIGGACLVLSASFAASRAYEGSTRFPLWVLLLALGLVAVAGGFVASFVRDEPETERRSTRRSVRAPRNVRVVSEEEDPDLEAVPSRPVRPERTRSEPPEIDAPVPGRGSIAAPPPPTAEPEEDDSPVVPAPERSVVDFSAAEALDEIDRMRQELEARPGRRSPGSSEEAPRTPPGASRASPRVCGSCGRGLSGGPAERCAGCGTMLCEVCFDGLDPPPCPSCAG